MCFVSWQCLKITLGLSVSFMLLLKDKNMNEESRYRMKLIIRPMTVYNEAKQSNRVTKEGFY